MALFELNTVKDSVKDDRDKYIGGSDLPKVNNPTSAERLIFEKTHKQKDFTSIYTEFGNIAEPIIREYVNETFYGSKGVDPSTTIIEREGKLGLRGNLDGDYKSGAVIEIKTLGENYFNDPSDFHKKFFDYSIQVAYYMMLKKYLVGYIHIFKRPEVLFGKPFNNWTVKGLHDRQTEVEEYIITNMEARLTTDTINDRSIYNGETTFIDEVKRRIELIDNAFAKHSVSKDKPTESEDEDLLVEYKELEEMEKTVATRKKEILEHFTEKYHENETFEIDGNSYVYTAERTGTRKSFNSKAFESDNPELYKKYIKESTISYKPSLKVK